MKRYHTDEVEASRPDANAEHERCSGCGGEKDAEGNCANYCVDEKPINEAQLDAMSNDGRLSSIAMRLAFDAGNDWSSLNGDVQDEWHETAIRLLRSGKISRTGKDL